jgi:hypothetical protein
MKNQHLIADGSYVREHRHILKDLGSWARMTGEEKQFFKVCYKCTLYDKYIADKGATPCPCETCQHRKTEIQVGNQMKQLRKKYLEGDL